MAPFNPKTPFTNINTINASKGVQADTSLGTLFSSGGNLLKQGVATAEQRTQNQITSDAQSERQKIDEDFGLPPAVKQSVGRLRNLATQFDQGIIDESLYHLRAGQITKAMRTKYPHWRKFVDKTILQEMGFDPANAIRQDAFNTFNRSRTQADRRLNSRLSQMDSQNGRELQSLFPAITSAINAGDYERAWGLFVKASGGKAQYDVAVREDWASGKGREEQTRRISSRFNREVPAQLNAMLDSTVKSLGNGRDLSSGYLGLQQVLQSTGPESVEKIQQMWTGIDNLYQAMSDQIDEYGRSVVNDEGQTVFDVLTPDKFNELKASYLAPFDRLIKEQGLRDSEGRVVFNAITGAAARMKLRTSSLAEQIRIEYPNLGVISAISEATNQSMDEIIAAHPQVQNDLGEAYVELIKTAIDTTPSAKVGEKSEPATTMITGNFNSATEPLSADEVKNRLLMWGAVLEGKEVNAKGKKNFFGNMFSAGNSSRLFLEFKQLGLTRQEVLVQMASDGVSKVAKQYIGTPTYNNYKNFMIEGSWLTQDVRDATSSLNEFAQEMVNQDLAKLSFDEATGRFNAGLTSGGTENLSPDDEQLFQTGTSFGTVGSQSGNTFAYGAAVDRMNVIMSLFDPLAEMENKNKGEFYQEVFQAWNTKFPDTPVSPLIQQMEQAIVKSLAEKDNFPQTGLEGPQSSGQEPGGLVEQISSSSFSPEEDQSILRELISFDAEDNAFLSEGSDADKLAKVLDIGETGGSGSYDITLGNSQDRFFPEGLTNTSIADVIKVGSARGKGSMIKTLGQNSTAVGRFQIVGKTLRGLVTSMGIDPSKKFDKNTQDKMFKELLRQRGFEDFLNGTMSLNDFVTAMQKEWEGFAVNREAKTKLIALLMSIR